MKTLSQWITIACILSLIISQNELKAHYQSSHKSEATILITDNLMICKSFFKKVHDKPVHYAKPLKVGLNSHYFVPFKGMGVNIEIIKYK